MTQPSPYKSTGGLLRIVRAFGYSLRGLGAAWRHEAAFRQETVLAAILIPLGLGLGDDAMERLLLAGAPVLVLVVELLNSAIEACGSAISPVPRRWPTRSARNTTPCWGAPRTSAAPRCCWRCCWRVPPGRPC